MSDAVILGPDGRAMSSGAESRAIVDVPWSSSGRTTSGQVVNTNTAITHTAVWRAITLIANAIAKTPIVTYRREGDQARERWRSHPIYKLLRHEPNPEMTA